MDLLKCSVIDEGGHGDLDIKKLLGHVIQEVFPSTMLMFLDKDVSRLAHCMLLSSRNIQIPIT